MLGAILLLVFLLPSQLMVVWIERRLIARFQIRRGPNRVGPWGLLQSIVDAIKLLSKEAIMPRYADKWPYLAAPVVGFIPAILVYAVIPFGPDLAFADLNIGLLYLVAIGSYSVISVFMAGWASSNKYALISAMRSVAVLVSYEIPNVLALVGVILLAGSLSLTDIVRAQSSGSFTWFITVQPLAFLIFFITASAEVNRTPVDLIEAEQEIVAGHHTEYSGMKFGLFYVAEYTSILAACAVMSTLFFGGWHGIPWLERYIPPWIWFIAKIYIFFAVFIWTRATLPRLRIDQLMAFAWKFLIPLSLLNILVTAVEVLLIDNTTLAPAVWMTLLAVVNYALAALLIVAWSRAFRMPRRRSADIPEVRRLGALPAETPSY
ncbi:MAG: NADH-quinone oxidoreductase subunit NuoH [Chloroflexi bacterium]|nr:NADH-quinone oxidoreductase subunit NuoH [Chloroflexota bacterium]